MERKEIKRELDKLSKQLSGVVGRLTVKAMLGDDEELKEVHDLTIKIGIAIIVDGQAILKNRD